MTAPGTAVQAADVAKRVTQVLVDLGLHRVRIDRWTLDEDPTQDSFYIEVGTVYREVTLRWRRTGSKQVQYHRIHLTSQIEPALLMIGNIVRQEANK